MKSFWRRIFLLILSCCQQTTCHTFLFLRLLPDHLFLLYEKYLDHATRGTHQQPRKFSPDARVYYAWNNSVDQYRWSAKETVSKSEQFELLPLEFYPTFYRRTFHVSRLWHDTRTIHTFALSRRCCRLIGKKFSTGWEQAPAFNRDLVSVSNTLRSASVSSRRTAKFQPGN